MNHLLRAEPLDSENHGQFVQELGELLATTQGRHLDHNVTQGMIDFAEYLQAARTMLPCSQNEFALRIGISEAQLVALEHGIMPRCAISGALLRRIAHTVGEEEEILSLILDGNSATRDRASVAGVLWASSHSARWSRLRPLALLACYLEQQEWSGNHYLFRFLLSFLTCPSLLYNHSRNLLDRLRRSRLTQTLYANLYPWPIPRLATAALSMLLVYWLVAGIADPVTETTVMHDLLRPLLPSSFSQSWEHGTKLVGSIVPAPSTLASPAKQEQVATPAIPTSVAMNKVAMAAEPVSRTRQSGNRAIYGTYQITYASAALIREVPVKAYIEVNEHEFAAIQFLNSTTISSRRCVSSGRFDLCPI